MVLLVAAPAEHIKAVKAGLVAQDCSEIDSALSSLVTWLTTVVLQFFLNRRDIDAR